VRQSVRGCQESFMDTLYKWEGQAEQGLLNWCAQNSK